MINFNAIPSKPFGQKLNSNLVYEDGEIVGNLSEIVKSLETIIPKLSQKQRLDLQNRVNEACAKAYYQS